MIRKQVQELASKIEDEQTIPCQEDQHDVELIIEHMLQAQS